MHTLVHELAARATRYLLAGSEEPALWTISVRGRVIGSLVWQRGERRIAWFDGAERALVTYAGPLDGDLDELAATLGRRLGAPVELQSLPV